MSHLTEAQIAQLARIGEIESYNPGEDIVVEGSLGDALFLILSGQVAVHRGLQTFATLGRRAVRRDVARRAGAALGHGHGDVGDVPVPAAA